MTKDMAPDEILAALDKRPLSRTDRDAAKLIRALLNERRPFVKDDTDDGQRA